MQKRADSRPDILRLGDMIDACEKIEKFIAGMIFEEFVKDDKTNFAVMRAFEILGEAAGRVSTVVKEKNTNIPWSNVIAMRNLLIHVYHNADLKIVWDTSKKDLPQFKEALKEVLETLKI